VSPSGKQTPGATLGAFVGSLANVEVTNNRIAYQTANQLDPAREHHALYLIGPLAARIVTGPGVIEIAQGGALVTGNLLQGLALTRLVEIPRVPITDTLDLHFEKLT